MTPQVHAKMNAPAEKAAGGSLSAEHREWIAGYLFVLPDALGLLIFVGAPMVLSLSLGFFSVSGFGGYEFRARQSHKSLFHHSITPLRLYSMKKPPFTCSTCPVM